MNEVIGVDLVDGTVEFSTTDSLVCHGADPNNPGFNLFTLTLSIETSDATIRELNPIGFADPNTGTPVTAVAVYFGSDVGANATDVQFDDPITVIPDDLNGDGITDTNIDIFDENGTSVFGPVALDITQFFDGGPWDGGTAVAFFDLIGDADGDGINDLRISKYELNVTYRAVTACPSDGCPSGFERGDVNQDGNVDLLDVTPFVTALVDGTFICEADVNEDGTVDLLDVSPFVELLTGG